ncbi:MAG: lipoyl(octanoyl) transferase LipB [Hyphomicrobiaceae bacterium]|nr:lipoyl(octanoyl) transferase LipB [Hyphomicrobiaceae bacterium]
MTSLSPYKSRSRKLYDPVAHEKCKVVWAVSKKPVFYETAITAMDKQVSLIAACKAPELVWLLEHPPIYTFGTSAKPEDLLTPNRFPVYKTGRGGEFTYHGPGQRVVYVMLDVKRRTGDVRAFVGLLENWLITTLAALKVNGETRQERVGIWVRRPDLGPKREDKIAAIGIRIRRWISFHGISLNVTPNLEHFSGIVPCGIHEHKTTSLADLGVTNLSMNQIDKILQKTFFKHIGGSIEHGTPPI